MTIYIFITVSGCVGRGPVHCFARGPIMLLRPPWYILCYLLFSLYYWYFINYLSALGAVVVVIVW